MKTNLSLTILKIIGIILLIIFLFISEKTVLLFSTLLILPTYKNLLKYNEYGTYTLPDEIHQEVLNTISGDYSNHYRFIPQDLIPEMLQLVLWEKSLIFNSPDNNINSYVLFPEDLIKVIAVKKCHVLDMDEDDLIGYLDDTERFKIEMKLKKSRMKLSRIY